MTVDSNIKKLIHHAYGQGASIYEDVLRIPRNSSKEEIDSAFFDRRYELYEAIRQNSNEKNCDNSSDNSILENTKKLCEQKMDALVLAYRILSDPLKRNEYDAFLEPIDSGGFGMSEKPAISNSITKGRRVEKKTKRKKKSKSANGRTLDSTQDDVILDNAKFSSDSSPSCVVAQFSEERSYVSDSPQSILKKQSTYSSKEKEVMQDFFSPTKNQENHSKVKSALRNTQSQKKQERTYRNLNKARNEDDCTVSTLGMSIIEPIKPTGGIFPSKNDSPRIKGEYEVENESVFSSDPVDEDVIASRHALAMRKRKMKKIQENLQKEAEAEERSYGEANSGTASYRPRVMQEQTRRTLQQYPVMEEAEKEERSHENDYFDGSITRIPTYDDESIMTEMTFLTEREREEEKALSKAMEKSRGCLGMVEEAGCINYLQQRGCIDEASFLNEMKNEVTGGIADTILAVDQILSAFTISSDDIDAMSLNIQQAASEATNELYAEEANEDGNDDSTI